jgi:hypothetical protein
MAITVSCECGKEFKVKDESAGKRIKCPACQTVLTVPDADAVTGAPPKAGKQSSAFEDLGGDGDEVVSRKGGKKKGSKTLLFVGLGGLLLVGCCCLPVVGGGVFFMFFSGGGTKTPPFEVKDKWSAADLQYELTHPKDPSIKKKVSHKAYKVELKAKKIYNIELNATGNPPACDPYLVIEDKNKKKLAEDDDSGGGLNAKIVFTPDTDGTYTIICATLVGLGDFTLSVKEAGGKDGTGKGKEEGSTDAPDKVVVGKWTVDVEETTKGQSPEMKKILEGAVKLSPVYEFNADGTITISGSAVIMGELKGKWRVSKIEGKTVTLHSTIEGGAPDQPLQITVISNDRIRIDERGGKSGKDKGFVYKRL